MKALSLALSLAASSLLHASPVASDNFDLPQTEGSKASVSSGLEWKTKGPNFTLQIDGDPDGLKSGNSLRIAMPFNYGGMFTTFPEVALAPGQSLNVSLRFRFATPPPAVPNGLRFGLFHNTSGTPADGSSAGYWLMVNPGSAAKDAAVFFEAGTDANMGGGQDVSLLGENATSFLADSEPHTLVFRITRRDSDTEVSWQIDDVPQSREDLENRLTTFNGFSITAGNLTQLDLFIDDVVITLEP